MMQHLPLRALLPGLALFLAGWPVRGQGLPTPAEAANYQTGGTLYAPLMEFISTLQDRSGGLMHVEPLATTVGGRQLVLCVLANPALTKASDLAVRDRPVVLIANNVHGNEFAGKDASLALMRDLLLGELRPLLDQLVVLVVPTLNPDGAEINTRTNLQGFDLNRDYIKLESREINALVTKVMNEWRPEIHADTHHGGSAPYTLTYQTNMNPAGDMNLVAFANDRILARVRQALRAEDYDGFWYSGPRVINGVFGWSPDAAEPRRHAAYASMANQIGFLFESPSSTHRVVEQGTRVVAIPPFERYRHQVRGQYLGLRELLRFAAENPQELMQVVAQARNDAVARGHDDVDGDQVPLDYAQVEKFRDNFWIPAGNSYQLVEGPVFTRWVPTRTATRPWGYLLEPRLANVIPLLLEHRVVVRQLLQTVQVPVEVTYASTIVAPTFFEGHYLRDVTAERRTETVTVPAGSFFVPSGQPGSNLVSYLLESETDDSVVTWGYLDHLLDVASPGEARSEQRIPLYRVMRQADLPGLLLTGGADFDPAYSTGVAPQAIGNLPGKVIGDATEVGPDIVHPNGNVYDQVLLTGAAATVTADPGQVTRLSYVDLNDDIVQVEFSGAGRLTLMLEGAAGPALPAKYNQDIAYMRGHAGITIARADETTHLSVFSVGRLTSVNPALFKNGVAYDGLADMAYVSLATTDRRFGSIRTANASYFATEGLTGIRALDLVLAGPVYLGDLNAFGAARPVLEFGYAPDVRVTGGDLRQDNGAPVAVSGLPQLRFVPGTTSHDIPLPAQPNAARLEQDGADVTAQIVVNPTP